MRPLLLLPLVACTSSPASEHIGVYFNAYVQATSLDVTLQMVDYDAQYAYDGITDVRASFRGHDVSLQYDERADPPYGGTIPLDANIDEGERVTFVLERGGELPVTVSGTAPADFSIEPPVATPAAQPFTVAWTPASTDPMAWNADPRCFGETASFDEGPIPHDTGSIQFPPGVLAPATLANSCSLNLTIERTRNTAAPTPFLSSNVAFSRGYVITAEVMP